MGWNVWLACWLAGTGAIAAAYQSRVAFDGTLQNSANGKVLLSLRSDLRVFVRDRVKLGLPGLFSCRRTFFRSLGDGSRPRAPQVGYRVCGSGDGAEIRWTAEHSRPFFSCDDFFLFLMVLAALAQQSKPLLLERENWGLGRAAEVRAGAERSRGVRMARVTRAVLNRVRIGLPRFITWRCLVTGLQVQPGRFIAWPPRRAHTR